MIKEKFNKLVHSCDEYKVKWLLNGVRQLKKKNIKIKIHS